VIVCRRLEIPVLLPVVAASVQFIPGYYYILTLQDMATVIYMGMSAPNTVVASMVSTGLLTLFISASIVFGTLLPMLVMIRKTRFY
jgi:hypothetical protein